MSDSKENDQLFFDFDDFSDRGTSHGASSNRKAQDDLTPGLFESNLTEEEEMDEFLREVRSSEASAEENPADESAGSPAESIETPPVEPISVQAAGPESSEPGNAGESSADVPAEKNEIFPVESGSAQPEPAETESAAEKAENRSAASGKERALTPKQLKRAAMAFLASLQPSGSAIDVAAGGRCHADAAAFWMEKGQITRTAIAEIRSGLDDGSADDGRTEIFDSLKLARMERDVLEQEIRRTEPDLRDSSQLFTEFSDWNYEVSKNPAYRECLQKIRRLERALYQGTRLERLIRSKSASELYLIVPENAVSPDYPLNGCGLVFIKKDLSFELVCPAGQQENVSKDHQQRLALNIAASNLPDVLFANGIHVSGGRPKCGPLPRRRHIKS